MLYASLIVVLAVLPVLFMYSRSAAFFAPMAWAYRRRVDLDAGGIDRDPRAGRGAARQCATDPDGRLGHQ